MQTIEQIGILVAAVAIDVVTAGALTPIIGAAAAMAIATLTATAFSTIASSILTPAQKHTLSLKDPIASHKVIYGQMKVGGAITFIDSSPDNNWVWIVITVTGHPVFSIDGFYLNDTYVPVDSSGEAQDPDHNWPDGTVPTNYHGYAQITKGLGTNAGDAAFLTAILASGTNKWGPNFFQYGRGKIFVALKWSSTLFGSTGVPNIPVVVRGRMVYDPRNPPNGTITNSSAGSPGVFNTASAHGLSPGQMVFIKGHTGAVPVSQPTWPMAQANAVAQEYEINTVPSGTSFTLVGADGQPLALSVGGNGGTVTQMTWSDNSALALTDYLVEPYHGMAVQEETEIDENNVITAANICDEIEPRILPSTTFTANPSTSEITWTENYPAGPLPPLCQVILTTTGILPGGLSLNTSYYYAQFGGGPNGFLCTSAENAAANPPHHVDISNAGTGTHTLTIVENLFPDYTTGTFWVYDNALRLSTGTEITLSNNGGALPSGLSAGNYYTIFLADNVIQLATTLDNARAGDAVSFSDNGSGTTLVQVVAEPRYTCNGVADTEESRQSIIQKMLTSMGGYLVPVGTFLNIYAAAYITPTVTLDEGDLRGPIQVTALQSGMQSFNSVKGTFVDPFNKGQPTDYPYIQNPAGDENYLAQDNGEVIWHDLNLPFTNSSSMAQRLAKIELERIRRELTVTMALKLTAFQVGSPDVIAVNNAQLGWDGETFEVSSWQFSIGSSGGQGQTLNCDIVGRQTDSAIYAWTSAEEAAAKRQTNTNLPNPFVVAPPSSLTLNSGGPLVITQQDGTIVSQIEVSWTSPVDEFVLNGGYIEIVYALHGSGNWVSAATVPGDAVFGFIQNAAIGSSYDIAVRSRNSIGGVSDTTHPFQAEIDGYVVQGKTNAPSNIATIAVSENSLTVSLVGSPITDTDVVVYEYRYNASNSWAGSILIEDAAAVPNGDGTYAGACTTGAVPAGTWWFLVKARNTSGIYSVNAASSQSTVTNSVSGANITPGTITAAAFAASIQPVGIVTTLTGLVGSYVGQLVVLTSDQQLYRWTGSAWTADVPAVNVTGQLTASQIASITAAQLTGQITTTQISNSAITTPLLAAGAVNSAAIAAGTIVAANIAAGTITGTLVAAGTIQGNNIASNTLTSGNIAANAIQAGQISVGAINASTLIVNNIIETGHMTANAISNSLYQPVSTGGYPSGSVILNTGNLAAYQGYTIQIVFVGSLTRTAGHDPTFTFQIVKGSSGGFTTNVGQAFTAGGTTDSVNMLAAACATETMGVLTYYGVQVTTDDGSNFTANAGAMMITILKA